MAAVFTYDVRFEPLAPTRDELQEAFEAERHAREAADEVRDRLTRAQCADINPLLPGDEYLLDEAESRREVLELLLGLRVARRRVVVPKPPVADWRDAQPIDWTRSRRTS